MDASPRPRRPAVTGSPEPSFRVSTINLALLLAGLLALALGYYLLAQGSHSSAPVLLALGYVVFLPLAIIL